MADWQPHIHVDLDICKRRAFLTGTRITVGNMPDNLAKGIEHKLLTDYRVVIRVPGQKFFGIDVDDPTIAQWIADRELVGTGTGIETDSESLAAQIGLIEAIKDYDMQSQCLANSAGILLKPLP